MTRDDLARKPCPFGPETAHDFHPFDVWLACRKCGEVRHLAVTADPPPITVKPITITTTAKVPDVTTYSWDTTR